MLTTAQLLQTAADLVLAAPSPAPTEVAPAPGVSVDTKPFVQFLVTQIVPVLMVILGIFFLSRANRGEVGKVVTSSGIVLIAFFMIAGAGTLFFAGDFFVDLIIKQ